MKAFLTLALFLLFRLTHAQLFINEVSNNNDTVLYDEDGDSPGFIELFYNGPDSVDLSTYFLSDKGSNLNKYQLPPVFLQTNEHYLVFASGKNRKNTIHHYETAVNEGDTWKYLVPTSEPPVTWTDPGFSAGGWSTGPGGLGYGDGDDATTVSATTALYMFRTFSISDTSDIENAILNIDYDDGFVAYFNGYEIARNNVGTIGVRPPYNATAAGNHEAIMFAGGDPEQFIIPNALLKTMMQNGTNVLAIQVHNIDIFSSDLTARAWLTFGIRSANTYYGPNPSFFNLVPSSITHTNFKINEAGEKIYLAQGGTTIADTVNCPPLTMNTSYARITSGAGTWCISTGPTPGTANATSICYTDIIAEPVFNLQAGHYSTTQLVTLSLAPGTSGTIYYSVDGDDPDAGELTYTGPITVSATTVIRARVFPLSGTQLPSRIVTRTFIINQNFDLPVFSICSDSVNLWDPAYGIHVLGYGADSVNYPYFGANFWMNWERPMHVEYFHKDKELKFSIDGGIKIHGGWSRGQNQKSLRLLAKSKYDPQKMDFPLIPDKPFVTSYSAINLRNGGNDYWDGRSRDGFMQRLCANTHVDYMGYEPAYAFLNGTFWGHLEIREREDEDYIEGNHGIPSDNIDIIAHTYNGLNAIGGNLDDFIVLHNTISTYSATATPAFYQLIDSVIDLWNFTDYIACETYLGNGDWASYPNNTKFWHRKSPYGKWRWVLWDVDFGLGYGGSSTDDYLPTYLSSGQYTANMLVKMLENPTYRNFFINRQADLINTVFQSGEFNKHKLRTRDSLYVAVQVQALLWGNTGVSGLNSEYAAMTTHNNQRINYQRDNLVNDFSLVKKVTVTLNVLPAGAGYIKISTIIPPNYPWNGVYFDGNPVTITAYANPGYTFDHWNPNSLIPTTYTPGLDLNISSNNTFTAVFTGSSNPTTVVPSEVNYHSDDSFDAGDWIELWNPGTSAIELTGYSIERNTPYQRYRFKDGISIPANGTIVLAKNYEKFTTAYPGFDTSKLLVSEWFDLNGSGDSIKLYNHKNSLVWNFVFCDTLPWKRAADETGRTMELIESDYANFLLPAAWRTSCMYGTPGTTHSPCAEPLVISEINYNPQSNTDEWIELYNNSTATINLSGYVIKDRKNNNTFTLPNEVYLKSGEYYVVARDTALFNYVHNPVKAVCGNYDYNFSNDDDVIRIYDSSGIIQYSVWYDSQNGWPAGANGNGKTLEPYGFTNDVNEGSNWFEGCNLGSPGWPYRAECYWGKEEECIDKAKFIYNGITRQLEVTFPYLDCNGFSFFIVDSKGAAVTSPVAYGSALTTVVNLGGLNSGIYFVKITNSSTGQQLIRNKWPIVVTP
ncbi:MAG TPA: lamin tail domain-containing protein [Flavobacteriales bacterium]|nr:lamin tail domain-containing protein [Flavobacteriales bacterium]